MAVEIAVDAHAQLGEGPVWDERTRVLWWLDIFAGQLHALDSSGGIEQVFTVGEQIGAIAPRQSGGLVMATPRGFEYYEPFSADREVIATVDYDPQRLRLNDGKCDSRGRFWAGTIAHNADHPTEVHPEPGGSKLYCLQEDHSVSTHLEGVTVSNGMGWSSDDRYYYYVDTLAFRVDKFDFDVVKGEIANRRPFVTFNPGEALPDGLCVDEEDHIWVAISNKGEVHRYRPDGTLDLVVDVPGSRVTSCAFGGDDLGDLYITTHSALMTDDDRLADPHAGALYRCRPGVRGLPTFAYAG
jgi:sugar lactone lactonase YvrE